MSDYLAQVAQLPDLSALLQLGGMSTVAGVLLWQMLRDRRTQQRSFNAMSCAVLSFQQMLLLYGWTRRSSSDETSQTEECKKCTEAIEALRLIIEKQGETLERNFREDK